MTPTPDVIQCENCGAYIEDYKPSIHSPPGTALCAECKEGRLVGRSKFIVPGMDKPYKP